MSNTKIDIERARLVAAAVADPELPFMTVEDLGILREIDVEGDTVVASVSPTYSGCPAVQVIEQDIHNALQAAGFSVQVKRTLFPPWTTDWITEDGIKKLLDNGIAPPKKGGALKPALFSSPAVKCPFCNEDNAQRVSEFGSTPCKAQYRCRSCFEPFDYFKCI